MRRGLYTIPWSISTPALGCGAPSTPSAALFLGCPTACARLPVNVGDPKKLLGLFYLEDFTMLKVMITAMATAAAVLAVLVVAGVLDLAGIAVQPTYLWPQLVGGLVLGIGFAIGGY